MVFRVMIDMSVIFIAGNWSCFFIDLVKRVHELNERVEDIQIEQNAQRVSDI